MNVRIPHSRPGCPASVHSWSQRGGVTVLSSSLWARPWADTHTHGVDSRRPNVRVPESGPPSNTTTGTAVEASVDGMGDTQLAWRWGVTLDGPTAQGARPGNAGAPGS